IRVENDARDEKIGYKIREAQLQKVPYMLVIGEKESEDGTVVAVRSRDAGDLGTMSTEDFIAKVCKQISDRED
ncbi:MAG: His/Gly/Thr/Pro-type tRNA ligase C-terminal domain-containing protein, partial [archaeon]|nr:His/Gly/Thr/Pro-type tRNA ligase C-terminal domain-containing protein [archaeon]